MKKTETLIRLPKDLKQHLAKCAEDLGVSQSEYVERLLLTDKIIREQKGA